CTFANPPTIRANGGVYSCTFRAEERPRQPGNIQVAVTAVFDNGAATATGNTTVTITVPPTFHVYLPVAVNKFVVSEPNNTACQAYQIAVNQTFHFLADDQSDWYRFALADSGSVVVELRNFVPRSGQLLVYRSSSDCNSLTNSDLMGQNGDFATTKSLHLGQRPAGQYYIRIVNDGVLNSNDPYQLQVIFNRP
ncbi:MAG TPA: PPC domain-containing protein, partial [Anaerolineae bacterium]